MGVYEFRKSSKVTSYNYRYDSMCAKDVRRLKSIKRTMVLLVCRISRKSGDVERHTRVLAFFPRAYFRLQYRSKQRVRRRNRHMNDARTIDSFSESECWQRFRTRKRDLPELLVDNDEKSRLNTLPIVIWSGPTTQYLWRHMSNISSSVKKVPLSAW